MYVNAAYLPNSKWKYNKYEKYIELNLLLSWTTPLFCKSNKAFSNSDTCLILYIGQNDWKGKQNQSTSNSQISTKKNLNNVDNNKFRSIILPNITCNYTRTCSGNLLFFMLATKHLIQQQNTRTHCSKASTRLSGVNEERTKSKNEWYQEVQANKTERARSGKNIDIQLGISILLFFFYVRYDLKLNNSN